VSDEQATLTADEHAAAEAAGDRRYRLHLQVEIKAVGPCRKHVRVTVPRSDLDHFRDEALREVADTAAVPGFRPGHVPRKLLERRFKKEIDDQVRQRVLLGSLEQMAEENAIDPINEPDFDIESLVLPEEGDFEYEFDVEVRPEFELPNYSGLKIKRPVKEITAADIDAQLHKFLKQYSTLVDKEGPAEPGDVVVVDIEFTYRGELLRRLSDVAVELKPRLQFPDGEISGFDQLMAGATVGTQRRVTVTISPEAESLEMRNEPVDALLTVKEVKLRRLPTVDARFLERIGVESEDELRDQISNALHRQVAFEQRQSARRQVLEKITESAHWELPESLVRKQVENALRREILEMQQAGFTTQEILARENQIRQRSISTTRQALKEHFVLDKIATKENIEATEVDLEAEIQMMALQRGENPRRVRARLVKSGVIENLAAQIRERKAIDFILKSAEYENVPMPEWFDDSIAAVSHSICLPAQGAETETDHGDDEA
jgi:trigger factor